jgi:hypothetical protein
MIKIEGFVTVCRPSDTARATRWRHLEIAEYEPTGHESLAVTRSPMPKVDGYFARATPRGKPHREDSI